MPTQFVALPGSVPGSPYGYGKTMAVVDLDLDGVREILIPGSLLRDGGPNHSQDWDGVRALDQPVYVLHYDRAAGLSQATLGGQAAQLVTGWTMDVAIADFNGDGKADVLWSDTGPEVQVNGQGALDHMRLIEASAGGPVVVNATASAPNVGPAAGASTPGTAFWHASGVGDFNGDGNLDFIAVNAEGGSIPNDRFLMGFLGDGHGNFTYTQSLVPPSALPSPIYLVNGQPTRWHPSIDAAGDLNGDGRPDLVVGNSSTSPDQAASFMYARETRIYWNSASGLQDSGYAVLPMPSAAAISASGHDQMGLAADRARVADLNGDGRNDVIVMFADYNNDVGRWGQVWLQNPDHTFRELSIWPNNKVPAAGSFTNGAALEPVDVNGDGLLDIVFTADSLSTLRDAETIVFINMGDETFRAMDTVAPDVVPATGPIIWWRFQDLDGDGQAELLSSQQPAGATERSITAYALQGSTIQAVAGTPTTGSIFADTMAGSAGADSLSGGLGHDVVRGGAGDDTVSAGAGNDAVEGGDGVNYLRGDQGDDSIVGGAGFDDINGNQGADTCVSGGGDDWVVGGKDNDSLLGSDGANLVYGNIGADTCDGGAGNDIVRGGQDNDSCAGGAGDDFVSGDKGDDTLSGGAGADRFHTFGDAGVDRVLDFHISEGDRVQLDPGTQYTVSQVGADTVISMTGGAQMILVGVSMSTLTGNWIFGA